MCRVSGMRVCRVSCVGYACVGYACVGYAWCRVCRVCRVGQSVSSQGVSSQVVSMCVRGGVMV